MAKKFRMKYGPKTVARQTLPLSVNVYTGTTLAYMVEWAEVNNVSLGDVSLEIQNMYNDSWDHYSEQDVAIVAKRIETDDELAVRHAGYLKDLADYEKWCIENEDEIERWRDSQKEKSKVKRMKELASLNKKKERLQLEKAKVERTLEKLMKRG